MFLSFCRGHYKSDKFSTLTPHHPKVAQSKHKLKHSLGYVSTTQKLKTWKRISSWKSGLSGSVRSLFFCRSDKWYSHSMWKQHRSLGLWSWSRWFETRAVYNERQVISTAYAYWFFFFHHKIRVIITGFFLSVLVWPLLPTHCMCRRSLLQLITLNPLDDGYYGLHQL
jgi:hypothetical protein